MKLARYPTVNAYCMVFLSCFYSYVLWLYDWRTMSMIVLFTAGIVELVGWLAVGNRPYDEFQIMRLKRIFLVVGTGSLLLIPGSLLVLANVQKLACLEVMLTVLSVQWGIMMAAYIVCLMHYNFNFHVGCGAGLICSKNKK